MAPPKVLMLVNAELGQANVFIATAHALLQENPGVDIHFASFPALQETLRDALGGAGDHGSAPFTFHPLPGRAMFKCFQEEEDLNNNIHTVSLQKPGVWNSPNSQKFIMTKAFLCWTAEEFASIYKSADAIIDHVKPDIVLVDTIFTPAITAARDIRANGPKDYKLAILSPNTLKDFVHHLEPGLAAFWKWPVVASANIMPIPWYWIPFNIYLVLRMIWLVLTNKNVANMGKKVGKLVGSPNLEIAENISLCHNNMKGIDKIFIGSRAEVDFPQLDLVNLPQDYWAKIVPCGPIVRPVQPIDAELSAWLQRRPTVLVNLGSHCVVNETEAVDMARSLRQMLDHSRKSGKELQVLWKMKKDSIRSPDLETGPGSVLYEVLGSEIDKDIVRIVQWLSSEPNSILGTGTVVCVINHGGANSFYEAVCAGVPQVIVPCWLDTYDFANRAELLGIGRWGSPKGCPRWTESEFAPILVDVAIENNEKYNARSRQIAEICSRDGGGRVTAARKILEWLQF
ncbi:unnamed protein product [Clonostachys rhizophaga]|uniref:UDP-glucoronosyl and UDP-glucosyl transferase family protein n=1 Tax=Clonostachys rhizophaga TaxID=160324 RepID=A0A9N9YNI4_9HYPO|nr:unnamed protein product [Clonostachys rhizophaga]